MCNRPAEVNQTIRRLCVALLALIALTAWRATSAEEVQRFIDAAKIAQEAASVSDFVPAGWRIEARVSGDLNGDAKPDTVLELIEDLPSTINDVANERHRALLVLLQTKAGRFQRVAVATKLLRCSTCFGTLAGPEGGGAEIKVVKGVLVVEELWGSRETVHTTLRFRCDPASSRIVLIGQDIERDDRATGAHRRESSNFLTGIKLTEGTRYDEHQDRLTTISPQKQSIPRVKRIIEDIDYGDFDR